MIENNVKDLIVIEQMPKIVEHLEIISGEIDKKIAEALALPVTDKESKKLAKAYRAELNKIKGALDEKRKQIKEELMRPYEDFMEVYRTLVIEKLAEADATLVERIGKIEQVERNKKEKVITDFANEWLVYYHIDDRVPVESIMPPITLTESEKHLKETIKDRIDHIASQMQLIEQEDFADEIMVEFLKTYDYFVAKTLVIERHKEMEKLAKAKPVEVVEEVEPTEIFEKPTLVENWQDNTDIKEKIEENVEFEEREECTFTVWVTKDERKRILDLIKEMGVKYE